MGCAARARFTHHTLAPPVEAFQNAVKAAGGRSPTPSPAMMGETGVLHSAMMTLRLLRDATHGVPTATSWYLADLGHALGKQELFTRQAPQKLKALREHALIESAISSNRIEGVEVEPARVRTVVFGKKHLRDRDEEEVRGYREALDLIHSRAASLPITEKTIRRLHAMSRRGIGDAGQYKKKENDIIEVLPDGRRTLRFRTVRAADAAAFMSELIACWDDLLAQRAIHPLIALAALNLDFLCIHPFRDGNGRVSRLLLLLACYHFGFEAGRYISLERLIEQSKDRYYETLKQSSHGWHEGKHDPWPYVNFVLYTLREAGKEFENRVGQTAAPRGSKTELVVRAIAAQRGDFRLADIERACPGVGRDWIRTLLAEFRRQGKLVCHGRGPGARWRAAKKGSTSE